MTINTKDVQADIKSQYSKQDIFNELDYHLLNDVKPSIYFNDLVENSRFKEYPFILLHNLKKAEQSPKYHPEGNVWNHTMLVVDYAAINKSKSTDARIFMWAALLHDIGKPDTTINKKGRITSYDHEKVGTELAREFLYKFTEDERFIEDIVVLIRWHMQILYVVKNMPFADIKTMKEQSNINEVALLGLCDRLGRLGVSVKEEENNVIEFIKKCE